jgi:flagellar M-ring protein FliF
MSNDDTQATSESLEVRQQIEHDLVGKISMTLEPLLGADKFRVGASVDCDLTSGEQQEETFDPNKSVMVSSQKTEDSSQKASTGGIPGTAANLPNPPPPQNGGTGTSHRTENVTYQTSRVVKHTRIPQGVIRRMSLSVLVGQDVRWEGNAKTRHRVAVPPSAETLKTIRDLIAGVTGLNTERGDQLIVETLPFEPSLTPDPSRVAADSTQPSKGPAWLQALDKYRDTIVTAVLGLALIGVLFRVVSGLLPARSRAESAAVLEAGDGSAAELAPSADAADLSQRAQGLLVEPPDDTANRVREFAQRDPAATANVLRMWMQEPKV